MLQPTINIHLWFMIALAIIAVALVYLVLRIIILRIKCRDESRLFKEKQSFDELIIDTLPFSIMLGEKKMDSDDNTFNWKTIKWNIAALKLLGNVKDKRLKKLLTPASCELLRKQIIEALSSKKNVIQDLPLTVAKGMRRFDALSFVRSFKLDNRSFLLLIIADITELKTAKSMAEETDEQRTEFLANISHEIRTPLNGILGFSNLLMDEEDPELINEFLKIIKRKNIELQILISDIMILGKMDSHQLEGEMTVVDVVDNIKQKRREYNQWIEEGKNVSINYLLPYSFFKVKVEIEILPYLFKEFVHNAVKFASHGIIRAGIYVEKERFTIFTHNEGDEIPLEKQIVIFKRFKKLDAFRQGTGLGLSVCLAIASRYDGQIGVYSKQGSGTLFWASLPISGELGTVDLTVEHDVAQLLKERWRGIWYDKDSQEPIIGVDDGELTIDPYTQSSSSSTIIDDVF